VSKRQAQGLVQAQPTKFRVLGPQQPLSTVPGGDDEHVVLRLAVLDRSWFVQDGDLVERPWSDVHFFLKLSHQRLGGRLAALAVPTDDVPHPRVEGSILRALREEQLVSANEYASSADPHGGILSLLIGDLQPSGRTVDLNDEIHCYQCAR
jgi:hypothetical protein